MARQDLPLHSEAASTPAEAYLALGLASISGRDGAPDRVEAHKWFNIAAARGCREAADRRCELAVEMSGEEIARAQRAAREWLTLH
ncbi:MAG: hypothetical protein ABWZ80_05995 [Beijerinckiaceae bacterium]